MTEVITSEIIDQEICLIKLNRPDTLNSLNKTLVDGLYNSIDECEKNDSIRSIIITGNGRGFCAGADLANGGWPTEDGWSAGKATNAINGIAAGGGVGLALCGDIVIASEKAKFKLVFGPQLGIIPDVGASWLVPNLIGRAKANGLALLGDDLDAKQAYEWGLIWQVVKNEDLLSEATKIAKRIADSAITGLKAVVKAHDKALVSTLDEQLNYERDTQEIFCNKEEFKEGVRAFLEKRKPNFKDIKN